MEESAGNNNVNRPEQESNIEPRQPLPNAEPFVPQDLQVETPKVSINSLILQKCILKTSR